MKIGTPESIGEANKKLILNHLRLKGDMSRADLTRDIKMSFPAVSSNIKHLLDLGYIREVGAGDNSVGRKSKLLSFNARRGFVIGIDIGRHEIRYMLADLLGNTVSAKVRSIKQGESGQRIVKNIVATARQLVKDAGVDDRKILSLCVGIPGIMRNGHMYAAPFISDFSLKRLCRAMEQDFDAEIIVENGVNLGAIGERWRGIGIRYTDFVYIGYGVGLGAALMLGGKLYRGVDGAAGEIGFMTVDPLHLRDRFDEVGALESVISRERITRDLAGRDFVQAMDEMARGAAGARTVRLLEDVSRYFSMALINISSLLNPQAIVVSGGIGRTLGEHFLPAWDTLAASHLPFPPEIVFSKLHGKEPLLGAIYICMEHVNNAPINHVG